MTSLILADRLFFFFVIYVAKGLCEETVKVLQIMEAEGIEPNLIMLNILINAFGIAGRHLEALSVYDHIIESVSDISRSLLHQFALTSGQCISQLNLMFCFYRRALVQMFLHTPLL